jgi:hypothetical protein
MNFISFQTTSYSLSAILILMLILPAGRLKKYAFIALFFCSYFDRSENFTNDLNDNQNFALNRSSQKDLNSEDFLIHNILSEESFTARKSVNSIGPNLENFFPSSLELNIQNEASTSEYYTAEEDINLPLPTCLCIHFLTFVSVMRRNTSNHSVLILRIFTAFSAILLALAYRKTKENYQNLLYAWVLVTNLICSRVNNYYIRTNYIIAAAITQSVISMSGFYKYSFLSDFSSALLSCFIFTITSILLITGFVVVYILDMTHVYVPSLMSLVQSYIKSIKKNSNTRITQDFSLMRCLLSLVFVIQCKEIMGIIYGEASQLCYVIPLFIYSYPLALFLNEQIASSYVRGSIVATFLNLVSIMFSLHLFFNLTFA